jgi:hypothetical protein
VEEACGVCVCVFGVHGRSETVVVSIYIFVVSSLVNYIFC